MWEISFINLQKWGADELSFFWGHWSAQKKVSEFWKAVTKSKQEHSTSWCRILFSVLLVDLHPAACIIKLQAVLIYSPMYLINHQFDMSD